jgi:uncharacterized protein (TIGR04255 family)
VRLPNAPLVEVIFELRWQVVKTEAGPIAFGYDPGFVPLAGAFQKAISEAGFKIQERVAPPGPPVVHQIVFRYRQKDAFPLIQLGHGILACNLSTEYEWTEFRKLIAESVNRFLNCYPDTPITPLNPCHLELRYVDVFNEAMLGHTSWKAFITKSTNVGFRSLKYLDNVTIEGRDRGSINLQYDLKDEALGRFEVQIANGEAAGSSVILMNSKVVKTNFQVIQRASLHDFLLKWADGAHDVTHNFFEACIDDSLMTKFQEKSV